MTLSGELRAALKMRRAAWTRTTELLTPAEPTTPDLWARANRVYPLSSGHPGPRDPGLTPYIVRFERFFDDARYETCILVAGTQVSKTDALLDVIGWRLDTKPRPQLYIGPSRDFVAEQFEPRLMALFDQSSRLAGRVARGKRNKKTRKIVNGVPVRLAWAGSASSLASDQAGDVYIDEYSKMFRVKAKAGDPFVLGKARADTYADRKIAVTSTPEDGAVTTERDDASGLEFWSKADPGDIGCATWRRWQGGTRHHWAWRCPHCAEWFIPRYRDLRWPEGASKGEIRRGTWLCCPVNGCVIEEGEKPALNAGGRYIAPGEYIRPDGTIGGDPEDTTTLSLWVSGLASPFMSWGERVVEVVDAEATGDPAAIKAAMNKVGELWANRPALQMTDADLDARVPTGFRLGMVPPEVLRVTLGADVQGNRIVYVVRGWGSRARSWLLDRGEVWGLTREQDVWGRFELVLQQTFDGLRVERALIDSGFRPDKKEAGDYHRVYDFCRRWSWMCTPTKGHRTQTMPVIEKAVEVAAIGKKDVFAVKVAHVDTDYFKSLVHSRLWTPADQPGALLIPEDAGDDYRRQLVSEVRGDDGVWTPVYRENHYFDCFDAETELLTEDGWKPVAEAVAYSGRFATVDLASDRLEYQHAIAATRRRHTGEMVEIKGRSVDLLVTPNHRLVTTRRNPLDATPKITLAQDLTIWHAIKKTARWEGNGSEVIDLPPSDVMTGNNRRMFEPARQVDAGDWCELMGWFVSEGHRVARKATRMTIITQNPGEKQDRILALLTRLGLPHRISAGRQIVIRSHQVYNAMADCYEPGDERGCFRKRVPSFVKNASPELIERFLDAAIAGDGWTQNGFRTYATTSRRLADDVQELMFKAGRSGHVRKRMGQPCRLHGASNTVAADQYHVSECKTREALLRQSDNTPLFRRVAYDGEVFCVTVPNGTLVARRNGIPAVVGNCEVLAAVGGFLIKAHQIPDGMMREIVSREVDEVSVPPAVVGMSVRDRMAARAARLNQL